MKKIQHHDRPLFSNTVLDEIIESLDIKWIRSIADRPRAHIVHRPFSNFLRVQLRTKNERLTSQRDSNMVFVLFLKERRETKTRMAVTMNFERRVWRAIRSRREGIDGRRIKGNVNAEFVLISPFSTLFPATFPSNIDGQSGRVASIPEPGESSRNFSSSVLKTN